MPPTISRMARRPRTESSDGLYHILNRGSFRSSIFESDRAKYSFVKTLFEACHRFSWRLHAYCVMGNHYHLCLGTPIGNLSEGMRWLQATYALRFNACRKEHGHLFQGRFKSLLVEPGRHWCDLIDYIHLNPVRAGLISVGNLADYHWSSLALFPKKRSRSNFLDCSWMDYSEGISDTAKGWLAYLDQLQLKSTRDPEEIKTLDRKMIRGWCIGDPEFKKIMANEVSATSPAIRLEKEALINLNDERWTIALESCRRRLGKIPGEVTTDRKSAEWKLAVAAKLRQSTAVNNAWLAEHLKMGTARSVSAICGKYERDRRDQCPSWKKLRKLTFEH